MSTDYRVSEKINASDLFGGRLEKFGVREHIATGTTERERCLTDGNNYLWVYIDDAGLVYRLSRYGGNAPRKILYAITEAFETDIFSEYEPQFWRFDTQQEWDTFQDKIAKEHDDQFYVD